MASREKQTDAQLLEERKVKALEKIAASVDAIAFWMEDIDKAEWSERLQWYLYRFHDKYVGQEEEKK